MALIVAITLLFSTCVLGLPVPTEKVLLSDAASAPSPPTATDMDPVSVRCFFSPMTSGELRNKRDELARKVASLALISPDRVQLVQAPGMESALIQSSEGDWATVSSAGTGLEVLIQIMPPINTSSGRTALEAAEALLSLKSAAWLEALGLSVSSVQLGSGILGEDSLGVSHDSLQTQSPSSAATATPTRLPPAPRSAPETAAAPKTAAPSEAAPFERQVQVRVTFKTLTPGDFAARHAELTVKIAGLVWVSPSRLRLLLSPIDDRAPSPPPAGTPDLGSGGGVTLLIVILPRKGAKEKSSARAADDLLAISREAWQGSTGMLPSGAAIAPSDAEELQPQQEGVMKEKDSSASGGAAGLGEVAASTAAASGGAAAATAAPKEEGHGDSAKYIVIGVVLGVIFSTVALIVYIRFCCARDAKDDDECDDGYTSPERGRVPARLPATPMPSARPGAPSSAAASSTYAKKKKHSAQYGDTGVC